MDRFCGYIGLGVTAATGPKSMSWDKYIKDGISAVSRADYPRAESNLKKALHFAKENFSREDGRLAVTLSLLGHMYFKNRDFVRAEALLEQSLRLHNQTGIQFDEPCVLMDLFSLGEIKKAVGKRVEAVRLYDETLRKIHDSGQHQRAVVQHATERFQQMLRNTKEQLSAGELETLEAPAPEPPVCSGETPVDCMPVQPARAAADSAEAQLQATAKMQEVWHKQLHNGLSALSSDDDERETMVTAYLNCESAFRLAQVLFSETDVRYIATLKGLADASAKLKLFDQAEVLYQQALTSVREKADDATAVASVHALRTALGLLYVDWNRFADAKRVFDEEEIPEDIRNTPAFANFCKRLTKAREIIKVYETTQDLLVQAQEAESESDVDKAARLTNNAISQLKQGFPHNHPETAHLLRYRAELLRKLGNEEQAQELEQRVERIVKANELAAAVWARVAEELPVAAVAQ